MFFLQCLQTYLAEIFQTIFSVMQPGTVVWPHTGPTNARLRLHLGLVVPQDYKNVNLTVAEQTRYWEEGKVLTFDDSFEHSVMHHGEHYRNFGFKYCLKSTKCYFRSTSGQASD